MSKNPPTVKTEFDFCFSYFSDCTEKYAKDAVKGRALHKDALPLTIPSSEGPEKSCINICQQCSTEASVLITPRVFIFHSAFRRAIDDRPYEIYP